MKRIVLMLVATVLMFAPVVHAQEMIDETAAEVETYYGYGLVISVTSSEIVLSEYDYDTDEDVNVTYVINANTEYENVASINDIVVDDELEIEYLESGDKNMALMIYKETYEDEDFIDEELIDDAVNSTMQDDAGNEQ